MHAEALWVLDIMEDAMDREHNISTDHQPKGSARNPSDTLDKPGASRDGGRESSIRESTAPVVDEKGRPLSGDGVVTDGKG